MLVGEEVRRLCAEGKVVCPQYLLDQLEEIGPACSGVLALTSGGCPLPVFGALATMLHTSACIHQLDLSDCLLTSDSLNTLIQGLMENTSVKTVLMKGNNISGNTVSAGGSPGEAPEAQPHHQQALPPVELCWPGSGVFLRPLLRPVQ